MIEGGSRPPPPKGLIHWYEGKQHLRKWPSVHTIPPLLLTSRPQNPTLLPLPDASCLWVMVAPHISHITALPRSPKRSYMTGRTKQIQRSSTSPRRHSCPTFSFSRSRSHLIRMERLDSQPQYLSRDVFVRTPDSQAAHLGVSIRLDTAEDAYFAGGRGMQDGSYDQLSHEHLSLENLRVDQSCRRTLFRLGSMPLSSENLRPFMTRLFRKRSISSLTNLIGKISWASRGGPAYQLISYIRP